MRTESFRTITYSDIDKFEKVNGRIQLKEYKENLIFYVPFDSTINAIYGADNLIATPTSSTYELMNFGVFSQHLLTETSIKYNKENFIDLTDEGTIQFRIRTDFSNGIGFQEFLSSTVSTIAEGTYSFYLSVDEDTPILISFDLDGTESFTDVFNTIAAELTPETGAFASKISNKIRISSLNVSETIEITEGEDLSIIDLLGGLGSSKMPNPPSAETTILSIKNESDNNNRIDVIHNTSGNLLLKMYNNSGTLSVNKDFGIWNMSYLEFYAFELSWNKNFAQVFIDGDLLEFALTGFTRGTSGDLYISGSTGNPYKIDELIVYNKHTNFISYEPSTYALTKYSVDLPYIDIDFGLGLTQDALTSIDITSSDACHFIPKLGNQFYYYLVDSWSFSDGSFSKSMSKVSFIENIKSLYLNSNLTFSIRVYFESDGLTNCYIDEISINENINNATSAKIVGVMSLKDPVNLSTGNDKFVIKTNVGIKEVSLITDCIDSSAVTLEEVKAAVNAAEVPGLKPASDDGSYHLVLESISIGSTAYVSVESV